MTAFSLPPYKVQYFVYDSNADYALKKFADDS